MQSMIMFRWYPFLQINKLVLAESSRYQPVSFFKTLNHNQFPKNIIEAKILKQFSNYVNFSKIIHMFSRHLSATS